MNSGFFRRHGAPVDSENSSAANAAFSIVYARERGPRRKGHKNIKLQGERVARFRYRPSACQKTCTVVVPRKDLAVEQGRLRLFDDVRYFFYLTNLPAASRVEVVFGANDRCNQENPGAPGLEQLRNGARAPRMPVDNPVSNWAYMVMAALACPLRC